MIHFNRLYANDDSTTGKEWYNLVPSLTDAECVILWKDEPDYLDMKDALFLVGLIVTLLSVCLLNIL